MSDLSTFIAGEGDSGPLIPDPEVALRDPQFPKEGGVGKFIVGADPREPMGNVMADAAKDTTPEQAAKVIQLQGKTGLPPEMIKANLAEVEQQANQQDFNAEEFRKNSPLVSQWMAKNPEHFALVKDDLDMMSRIEALTTAASRGYELGQKGTQLGRISYGAMGRTPTPQEQTTMDALDKELQSTPTGSGFSRRFMLPAAQFIGGIVDSGQQALKWATYGASAGTVLGATVAGPVGAGGGAVIGAGAGLVAGFGSDMFKVFAGGTYHDLGKVQDEQGNPINENVRMGASLFVGLTNAALATVGVGVLTMPYRAVMSSLLADTTTQVLTRPTVATALAKFGESYALSVGTNTFVMTLQETVNQMSQDMAKEMSDGSFRTMYNDPEYRAAFISHLADTASETFRAMLLIGAPGAAIPMTREMFAAREAKKREDFYKALGEDVSKSKTFQRLPEAMQEAIRTMTEGKPIEDVYIDQPAWDKYWQEKSVDPKEAARQVWGDTHEYDAAKQGDTPMRLSMADYATRLAPTEHNAFFASELRAGPDAMNAREARALAEQVATEAEKKAKNDQMEAINKTVTDKLEAIGYERKTAETMAKQMGAFFNTMAQRMGGLDPLKLFKKYGLKIGRPEKQALPKGAIAQPEGSRLLGELTQEEKTYFDDIFQKPQSRDEIQKAVPSIKYENGRMEVSARDMIKLIDWMDSKVRVNEGGMPKSFYDGTFERKSVLQFWQSQLTGKERIETLSSKQGPSLAVAKELMDTGGKSSEQGLNRAFVQTALLDQAPQKRAMRDENGKIIGAVAFGLEDDGKTVYVSNLGSLTPGAGTALLKEVFKYGQQENAKRVLLLAVDASKGFYTHLGFTETESGLYSAPANLLMQEERGFIQVSPDKKISIAMLENADLSTFLHESGHFYLEVLRDFTNPAMLESIKQFFAEGKIDPAQLEQLKADVAVLHEWLGVKSWDEITTKQHEQFARGIEAYFMEGKAPSPELRGVFARFRAWLVAIYTTLNNLHVRLNDDVRAVMDRLFATQEEIRTAQEESEVLPMFIDAKTAGMSEVEFAAYTKLVSQASVRAQDELQQKLMRQMNREQSLLWKEHRAGIEADVVKEVDASRDYQALNALREDPLSRDSVQELYPTDTKNRVTNTRNEHIQEGLQARGIMRVKGERDPNAMAEGFGYGSGDEMIQALAWLQDRNVLIKQMTDQRMKAKYGDMMTDGTIADKARQAVLGPERSKVVEAELKALRKRQREAAPVVAAKAREQRTERKVGLELVREATPSVALVRQVAAAQLAGFRVRTINPNVYLTGLRQSSKAAMLALNKGDYAQAAYHKQKELLNIELYREAQRIKDDVESIVDYMRKFRTDRTRARLGQAGGEYLAQIDAILQRFDFAPISLKEIDKRKSLVEWIKSQEAQGLPVNLSEDIVNEAYRKPWKEMTYEELQGIRDAAKHISHLASLKNKLLTSKDKRELEQVQNLISETILINARNRSGKSTIETRLPQSAPARAIAGFLASTRKISSLVFEMDGFKLGPIWDLIVRPMNESATRETMMHHDANMKWHEIFQPYIDIQNRLKSLATSVTGGLFERGIYAREFIPEINMSLSKVGRLMVALNWGNETNRARIMEGYNWTPHQVQVILDALTKEDWDFVQKIWDMNESYWPEIKALSERVDGVAPEHVQPMPVSTQFGEYRGGYFHIAYDDRQSPRAYADAAKETAERAMKGAAIRAVTAHGFRLERVDSVKRPVRLDFGVIFEHVNAVIHDLTHYELLIDMNRLIGSGKIQQAMIQGFGSDVYKQFRSALQDIAGGTIAAQSMMDRSMNWARQGVSIAGLGWNVMVSLLQPLGLMQSMVRIGPQWVARGVYRWMRDAASMTNTLSWIHDRSDFMKIRSDTQMREINEIREKVNATASSTPVTDSYLWLITRGQLVADIPTWLGMYERAMEHEHVTEEKAVAMADQAVKDSQGGGQLVDLPDVLRGSPLKRIWTTFYSYFNTTLNLTAESYRHTLRDPMHAGRFAVDLLLLYTLPSVLGTLMQEALRQDSQGDWDKIWKRAAQQQMSYILGVLPYVRELGSATQGFDYKGPAGARLFSSASEIVKQAQEGHVNKALWHALNQTAGILFHYPAAQVQRMVDGYVALKEGRTDNPMVLLTGPAPKQP